MNGDMAYIRRFYGLTCKLGDPIEYLFDGVWHLGRITMANGPYLICRFPTLDGGRKQRLHPTWNTRYPKEDGR